MGDGILQLMQQMMSNPETMFDPLSVTPAVKKKISSLPVAKNQTWMATITVDAYDEGTFHTANVFLVDKEKGSNGMPLGYSDGVGMHLATAGAMSPTRDRTDQFPVLLGAIATACLEPMKHHAAMFPTMGMAKKAFPSQTPGRLLLDASGTMEQLRPALLEMEIANLDVADTALIQSVTPMQNLSDCTTSGLEAMGKLSLSTNEQEFREAAAEMIMSFAADVYVSEEPQPFNGWVPPDSSIPRDWFIRPPPDGAYRLTELWGWRTNLERAVLQTDVEEIQEIAQRCDSDEVREFCECRTLLTKVAEKGMLKSCEALLDFCSVAVDGVQDTPSQWKRMQKEAGDTGTTPLH